MTLGWTVKEAAKAQGLSERATYRWLARYRQEGPAGLVDRSPLAAFAAALTHERSITKKIYALVDKAAGEKDHGTANFLQWYVKEQVEEEASVEPIVKQLEAIGDHLGALYHLDHQLGKRQ